MDHEQIANALDDAADYIEQHGWFSVRANHYSDGDDPACAVVAIDRVAQDRPYLAVSVFEAWLGTADGICDLVAWNNAPERTKQEVLDAFRAVAKQERGQA